MIRRGQALAPTVPRRQQKTLSCGFRDGMREENTSRKARLVSKAKWVKYGDDSVWPNLYLSILAPTPMRSTLLSGTSSTRITPARPLIKAYAPCATSQGGKIENQTFVPTLSRWSLLK